MDVAASVIELKPNSLDVVDEWTNTINQRIEEAVATLKGEGVQLESWFHLSLDGKDYLLSYMRAESIDKAYAAASHSRHDIDAYHQQFKANALGKVTKARLLVDLVGIIS